MKAFAPVPVLLILVLLIGAVPEAKAQVAFEHGFGGQISYGFEDQALGLGLRSETRISPVPAAMAISWDYFFPRCGMIGCTLWQLHANAKVDLDRLLPFHPFVGGGINYRYFSVRGATGADRATGTGMNVIGGIWSGRSFIEGRYEIMNDEQLANQLVLSLGFLF